MAKLLLPPPNKRRAGAPAGNTNALQHGFYPRQLRSKDLADLDNCQSSGLTDEITMLRVMIRRVVEMGKGVDNLYDGLNLMRGLCFATTSLTRLIKTQHLLNSPADEVSLAIRQALEEVGEEMELTDQYAGHDSNPTWESAIPGVDQSALDRPGSEKAPPE